MNGSNDEDALRRRMNRGALTWPGPALMLFARSVWGVAAQAVVAAIFAWRSSPGPWHVAERLIPFAIAHALMDGASVRIGVLLPQLTG